LPEHLQNQLLLLDQAAFHEIMNLLQQITSHCEFLEGQEPGESHHLVAIRKAVFKVRDRLNDYAKIA
jgi:uncharacterized protein YcsI (UPF0317 family)